MIGQGRRVWTPLRAIDARRGRSSDRGRAVVERALSHGGPAEPPPPRTFDAEKSGRRHAGEPTPGLAGPTSPNIPWPPVCSTPGRVLPRCLVRPGVWSIAGERDDDVGRPWRQRSPASRRRPGSSQHRERRASVEVPSGRGGGGPGGGARKAPRGPGPVRSGPPSPASAPTSCPRQAAAAGRPARASSVAAGVPERAGVAPHGRGRTARPRRRGPGPRRGAGARRGGGDAHRQAAAVLARHAGGPPAGRPEPGRPHPNTVRTIGPAPPGSGAGAARRGEGSASPRPTGPRTRSTYPNAGARSQGGASSPKGAAVAGGRVPRSHCDEKRGAPRPSTRPATAPQASGTPGAASPSREVGSQAVRDASPLDVRRRQAQRLLRRCSSARVEAASVVHAADAEVARFERSCSRASSSGPMAAGRRSEGRRSCRVRRDSCRGGALPLSGRGRSPHSARAGGPARRGIGRYTVRCPASACQVTQMVHDQARERRDGRQARRSSPRLPEISVARHGRGDPDAAAGSAAIEPLGNMPRTTSSGDRQGDRRR